MAIDGRMAYVIELGSATSFFDSYLPIVQKIIDSFEKLQQINGRLFLLIPMLRILKTITQTHF
jgi:hypothetical protein